MKTAFIHLFVTNFFKFTFTLIIMGVFLYILLPFMLAIILGGILAMALAPFVEYLIRRGLSRNTSLVVFTFLLGLVGFIPVVAFFMRGSKVISQLLHESNFARFGTNLTIACHKLIEQFSHIYGLDSEMAKNQVSSIIIYSGNYLSLTFSNFISELPVILMFGGITTLSVYFFLSQSDQIRRLFDRYFYFSRRNGNDFVQMFKHCCREVFFTNIITGIIQAFIVSTGAYFFGVGDFFLIFFVTFVVSFIPIIGAAPVAVVCSLICLMDERLGASGGMMLVAIFASISDNIIRPYLGSLGEVEVHPFIGLLAVIGGVMSFGFPGLFIGPMIASIYFGALPIIIDEYFPPVVPKAEDGDCATEIALPSTILVSN